MEGKVGGLEDYLNREINPVYVFISFEEMKAVVLQEDGGNYRLDLEVIEFAISCMDNYKKVEFDLNK